MLQCYNFKNQKQTNKLHLKNSLNTSIRLVFLDSSSCLRFGLTVSVWNFILKRKPVWLLVLK